MARHRQFNFGSRAGTAPELEARTDGFRSLAHARKPPVAFPARTQELRIDPGPVVADQQPQVLGRVRDFHFDAARLRVTERVDQRLASDAVDLITNYRVQRTGCAFDDDPKPERIRYVELGSNPGERLFEIVEASVGRSQSAHGVASLFDDVSH